MPRASQRVRRFHSGRKVSSEHKSQSERDWSYAKRARRGDSPEVVIQRIADYGRDERHPGYAQYTVQKAQAEREANNLREREESRTPGDL